MAFHRDGKRQRRTFSDKEEAICVRVEASEQAIKCFLVQSMLPAAMLDNIASIPRKRGAARIEAIARYLGVPKP